jgi:NAD(P)-dependent dehydrogenase (short-subunit alcohol dehydrogenase family)
MSERVVLITGANGGLGTAITDIFLLVGARVIGAARKIESSDFPHTNFEALQADFTKAKEVHTAIENIIAKYGRLDVLVHVLGAFAGGQSIATTTDNTWEQMRDLNLTSAFYTLRETIPHLRKSTAGRIIVIGSLAAKEAHVNIGAYVVFKTALAALVQTVALENADVGLTANVVLPGTMNTPANRKSMPGEDFSKWVKTDDVSSLVLWLADDHAGHITGAAIPIDGKHG